MIEETQKQFFELCLKGDVDGVKEILATELPAGEIELDGLIDFTTPENKPGEKVELKRGVSAMHIATYANRLDVAKLLIDRGANVNVQDKFGAVPLFIALAFNRGEMEELLNEGGADSRLLNTQIQIIGLASSQSDILSPDRKAEIFEQYELNPKAIQEGGLGLLHLTACWNYSYAIEFLATVLDVNEKVAPDCKYASLQGLAPVEIAAKKGNLATVEALVRAGAARPEAAVMQDGDDVIFGGAAAMMAGLAIDDAGGAAGHAHAADETPPVTIGNWSGAGIDDALELLDAAGGGRDTPSPDPAAASAASRLTERLLGSGSGRS